MEAVRVESFKNMQHIITTPGQAMVADEPPGQGDGLGPNPYELLLASLGT